MYESFFGMEHTPFVRDVPPEKLYESNAFRETLGRLSYVADRQMFAVVRDCWISWDLNPGFIAVIPNVSFNRRLRSSGECNIEKSSVSLMKHI